jgi:hypothetical protein
MTNKERFKAALAHKTIDKISVAEVCFWPKTVGRWRKECLPTAVDPSGFSGLDKPSELSV